MKISIFGLGYVGCISMGCLANIGHSIIGVDINPNKIYLINQGKPTIIEQDIDSLISKAHAAGLIKSTVSAFDAVKESDITIIAVGTPSTKEGHLNLSYIYKVAEEIGEALKNKTTFHVITIRSTVLPGTNKKVTQIVENVSGKKGNIDFAVVSNPEFLREGSAVKDYFNPPVTVIGTESEMAAQIIASLYNKLPAPIQIVPVEVAELIKYVNNTWHALKVAFGNEVGNICKNLNIDSHKVMDLFCMDTQLNLSPYYLKPGFAYGGSCLPKDLKGLRTLAHDFYLSSPIIENIEYSNTNQKRTAIQLIEKQKGKKLGILGFSFKAGTDDLRYSPIVEVAEYFLGKGYKISIYDKNVNVSMLTGTNKDFIEEHIPHFTDLITDNINKVIKQSEIIIFTHKIENANQIMLNNPEKTFIDLVRTTNEFPPNYSGICW